MKIFLLRIVELVIGITGAYIGVEVMQNTFHAFLAGVVTLFITSVFEHVVIGD